MVTRDSGEIAVDAGLVGDHKGPRFPKRRITIMAAEDWAAALHDIGLEPDEIAWTTRRANLLTRGIRLPRAAGAILRIGADVRLHVTGQTVPCRRMDEAMDGLRRALAPHWRGGVTCSVGVGGHVRAGDEIEVMTSPPEHVRRLP